MATLFSRIIHGEIPSYKIYEDDFVYAFLDIFPQQLWHTLIVPKTEIDYFVDLPEPYYSAIFLAAKKIAPALQKATGCNRVCTSIVGYEVPHVHYHLIPTKEAQEANFHPTQEANKEDLERIHAEILSYMKE